MGAGGGGGGSAFRIQSVTDRGPNVVDGNKLFIKSLQKIRPAVRDLHNEATEPQFLHTSCSLIYVLKLFFCLSHFASTTEGSLLGSNLSTQAMFTPIFRRLAAGLQAVPYTHCEKFCQFHQLEFLARRQSVVSLSLSYVTVYTSSHQTRTL